MAFSIFSGESVASSDVEVMCIFYLVKLLTRVHDKMPHCLMKAVLNLHFPFQLNDMASADRMQMLLQQPRIEMIPFLTYVTEDELCLR